MVRRYHEAVEVQSRPDLRTVAFATPPGAARSVAAAASSAAVASGASTPEPADREAPTAFVWRGRLYVVHEVLDHWRERRAWWRGSFEPTDTGRGDGGVPGPDELEHEVWRVVASAGRDRSSGVYDLAGGGPERAWRLVRVAD